MRRDTLLAGKKKRFVVKTSVTHTVEDTGETERVLTEQKEKEKREQQRGSLLGNLGGLLSKLKNIDTIQTEPEPKEDEDMKLNNNEHILNTAIKEISPKGSSHSTLNLVKNFKTTSSQNDSKEDIELNNSSINDNKSERREDT